MLSERDIFPEFERLLKAYSVCLSCADALESPNRDDNRFIKMAIVGFSYYDETQNWGRGQFDIASEYQRELDSLDDSDQLKLFSMLALGALLGLYSAQKIDDRIYTVGVAQLPGFVRLKGGAIEALPV